MKVSRLSSPILLGLFLPTGMMATSKPADAAFPGKNGKIAVQIRNNGVYDIYTMNPDGSGQTRLTTEIYNSAPVWSPDGQWIAFERNQTGTSTTSIWVMKADGSGQRKLTNNTNYGENRPT